MEIFFFLSGGLFLGWSLGANDAANIFGTAVGTRMIKFAKAAIIGSVFVMLGATIQGSGTTNTLSQLGRVDALGGAFTVALCSAMIVAIMTKLKLPVSTGQAIVGSIVAWCYFTSNPVDYSILSVLVSSWIYGPILGAIFAALLFVLFRRFIKTTTIHVIKLDMLVRFGLIAAGAFGAYSLGANNIANVMGVFVNSADITLQIGILTFHSVQVLFFLGGAAIALGILTYSKKVMETVGGDIVNLTPENALVVVVSQSLVLFIFSSTTLSNIFESIGLPAIPLVPVSSTQVVVGSVLGIGLVRGIQEVRFSILGNIAIGWISTPILSGLLTFISLFFVQNVFDIGISKARPINDFFQEGQIAPLALVLRQDQFKYLYLVLIFIAILLAIRMFIMYKNRKKEKRLLDEKVQQENEYVKFHKEIIDLELKTVFDENYKVAEQSAENGTRPEFIEAHMKEFKEYLESVREGLNTANIVENPSINNSKLVGIIDIILGNRENGSMDVLEETEYVMGAQYFKKLVSDYPNLTKQELKLALLIVNGFSDEEALVFMNISKEQLKGVRYRLRKKLSISKANDLKLFLKSIG
jgi:inorganic phosphate transporter, PiT family